MTEGQLVRIKHKLTKLYSLIGDTKDYENYAINYASLEDQITVLEKSIDKKIMEVESK